MKVIFGIGIATANSAPVTIWPSVLGCDRGAQSTAAIDALRRSARARRARRRRARMPSSAESAPLRRAARADPPSSNPSSRDHRMRHRPRQLLFRRAAQSRNRASQRVLRSSAPPMPPGSPAAPAESRHCRRPRPRPRRRRRCDSSMPTAAPGPSSARAASRQAPRSGTASSDGSCAMPLRRGRIRRSRSGPSRWDCGR